MTTYLPPLPVLPGENKTYRYVPPGRSIIAVLADDHADLADRIAALASAPMPDRRQADRVTAAIARHLSAERQYLYPVVGKLFPGQANGVADLQIDHDEMLLQDLTSLGSVRPESQAFRRSVQAIAAAWQRHRQACDRDIFPSLLSAVSDVDLIRLGNRAEVAREAAPTRAHPGAPQRPPWNKLTDAILGAIDKVRDLATGRQTHM